MAHVQPHFPYINAAISCVIFEHLFLGVPLGAIVAEAHADIALRGVLIPAPRTGTAQVNPMVKILGAASDRVARLASELGLTAVARDKVKPSPRHTDRGPSLLARIMQENTAAGPSPASKYLKST